MENQAKELKVKRKWHQTWWGVIILIILVILVIYLAIFIYQVVFLVEVQTQVKNQQLALKSVQYFNTGLSTNPMDIIETDDDPHSGPTEAKLVIVVFADFQCPYCKEVQPIIKQLRQEYKDSVKIIFRDLPNVENHPQALDAAMAAECTDDQNLFWEYHDLLFANQSDLSIENLKLLAYQIGMNASQFNQCLDDKKYMSEVLNDLQDGLTLGISGTPTFFINGNKVPGVIPYTIFKQIIDNAL